MVCGRVLLAKHQIHERSSGAGLQVHLINTSSIFHLATKATLLKYKFDHDISSVQNPLAVYQPDRHLFFGPWLRWPSTEMLRCCAPEMLQLLPQSLSHLQWTHTSLTIWTSLPFSPANFMPPLSTSLNVLYSLTTFPTLTDPPSQAKPVTFLLCPQSLVETGTKPWLYCCNYLHNSVSLTWLCLSFYLSFSRMPDKHRRYSIIDVPFPFPPLPTIIHFPGRVKPPWWAREGGWEILG